MKNNDKSFAYYFGQAISGVFIACLAACLCGIMIALTIGFLKLIF